MTLAPPPGSSLDEAGDRTQAARDVVRELLGVRRWFRESSRWAYPHSSGAALMVLALIEGSGRARVSELADSARVDVSVVSRQVQQLELSGLVLRDPDPRDGRAHLVSLTDQGHEVLAEGRRRLESVVAERLSGWTPEQLTGFAATLHDLLHDLGG